MYRQTNRQTDRLQKHYLQITDMSYHMSEQRIAGNVEWNPQTLHTYKISHDITSLVVPYNMLKPLGVNSMIISHVRNCFVVKYSIEVCKYDYHIWTIQ